MKVLALNFGREDVTMRYWGQNIHINGQWINSSADPNQNSLDKNPNAEAFEVEIQNQFRILSINPVPNAVLTGFQSAKNSVTVRPLSKAAAKKAASISVLEKDANETELGSPASAGKGSPVNVWMNEDSVILGGHQYRSKDTLLHECFHAWSFLGASTICAPSGVAHQSAPRT